MFNQVVLNDFLKITIVIIFSLYAIFSLIIVRQVNLMSRTLLTSVSPIVAATAIIHAGFAVGITVFLIGTL